LGKDQQNHYVSVVKKKAGQFCLSIRPVHMPLDGHLYLVNQGWRGKGTGLREGAITRPLAIPQKKNLAGLGKDRDESFPFWDQ